MNVAEALRFKASYMEASEDDFHYLEVIIALREEVLRLREDNKQLKKQIKD